MFPSFIEPAFDHIASCPYAMDAVLTKEYGKWVLLVPVSAHHDILKQ